MQRKLFKSGGIRLAEGFRISKFKGIDSAILITHPSHRRYDAEWEIEWALKGQKFDVFETEFHGVLLTKIENDRVYDAYEKIKNFDTSSIFRVVPLNFIVNSKMHEIKEYTKKISRRINKRNKIAVRCKRRGDEFESSKEIEREIGALVVDLTEASVDLENPDYYINIEIIGKKTGIGISKERLTKSVKE